MGNDISQPCAELRAGRQDPSAMLDEWPVPPMVLFVEKLSFPNLLTDMHFLQEGALCRVSAEVDGQPVEGAQDCRIPTGPIELAPRDNANRLQLKFFRSTTVLKDEHRQDIIGQVTCPVSQLVRFGAPLYTSLWLGLSTQGENEDILQALSRAKSLDAPKMKLTIFRPKDEGKKPATAPQKLKPDLRGGMEEESIWDRDLWSVYQHVGSAEFRIAMVEGLIRCLDESHGVVQTLLDCEDRAGLTVHGLSLKDSGYKDLAMERRKVSEHLKDISVKFQDREAQNEEAVRKQREAYEHEANERKRAHDKELQQYKYTVEHLTQQRDANTSQMKELSQEISYLQQEKERIAEEHDIVKQEKEKIVQEHGMREQQQQEAQRCEAAALEKLNELKVAHERQVQRLAQGAEERRLSKNPSAKKLQLVTGVGGETPISPVTVDSDSSPVSRLSNSMLSPPGSQRASIVRKSTTVGEFSGFEQAEINRLRELLQTVKEQHSQELSRQQKAYKCALEELQDQGNAAASMREEMQILRQSNDEQKQTLETAFKQDDKEQDEQRGMLSASQEELARSQETNVKQQVALERLVASHAQELEEREIAHANTQDKHTLILQEHAKLQQVLEQQILSCSNLKQQHDQELEQRDRASAVMQEEISVIIQEHSQHPEVLQALKQQHQQELAARDRASSVTQEEINVIIQEHSQHPEILQALKQQHEQDMQQTRASCEAVYRGAVAELGSLREQQVESDWRTEQLIEAHEKVCAEKMELEQSSTSAVDDHVDRLLIKDAQEEHARLEENMRAMIEQHTWDIRQKDDAYKGAAAEVLSLQEWIEEQLRSQESGTESSQVLRERDLKLAETALKLAEAEDQLQHAQHMHAQLVMLKEAECQATSQEELQRIKTAHAQQVRQKEFDYDAVVQESEKLLVQQSAYEEQLCRLQGIVVQEQRLQQELRASEDAYQQELRQISSAHSQEMRALGEENRKQMEDAQKLQELAQASEEQNLRWKEQWVQEKTKREESDGEVQKLLRHITLQEEQTKNHEEQMRMVREVHASADTTTLSNTAEQLNQQHSAHEQVLQRLFDDQQQELKKLKEQHQNEVVLLQSHHIASEELSLQSHQERLQSLHQHVAELSAQVEKNAAEVKRATESEQKIAAEVKRATESEQKILRLCEEYEGKLDSLRKEGVLHDHSHEKRPAAGDFLTSLHVHKTTAQDDLSVVFEPVVGAVVGEIPASALSLPLGEMLNSNGSGPAEYDISTSRLANPLSSRSVGGPALSSRSVGGPPLSSRGGTPLFGGSGSPKRPESIGRTRAPSANARNSLSARGSGSPIRTTTPGSPIRTTTPVPTRTALNGIRHGYGGTVSRAPQVQQLAQQPGQQIIAEACSCGNHYTDDSRFCRKCGQARAVEAKKVTMPFAGSSQVVNTQSPMDLGKRKSINPAVVAANHRLVNWNGLSFPSAENGSSLAASAGGSTASQASSTPTMRPPASSPTLLGYQQPGSSRASPASLRPTSQSRSMHHPQSRQPTSYAF